jgi:hypothetical protein
MPDTSVREASISSSVMTASASTLSRPSTVDEAFGERA